MLSIFKTGGASVSTLVVLLDKLRLEHNIRHPPAFMFGQVRRRFHIAPTPFNSVCCSVFLVNVQF